MRSVGWLANWACGHLHPVAYLQWCLRLSRENSFLHSMHAVASWSGIHFGSAAAVGTTSEPFALAKSGSVAMIAIAVKRANGIRHSEV